MFKKSKGFTLTELVLILAILVILAAMLLPMFTGGAVLTPRP